MKDSMTEAEYKEWKIEKEIEGAVLQVRVQSPPSVLHLQGYGEQNTNRVYGFAHKFNVPEEITNWLMTQKKEFMSLASAERLYIRGVEIMKYDNGYQLNIKATDGTPNHTNCWVLDLHEEKSGIAELIDFANNNGLIETLTGDKWVGEA